VASSVWERRLLKKVSVGKIRDRGGPVGPARTRVSIKKNLTMVLKIKKKREEGVGRDGEKTGRGG